MKQSSSIMQTRSNVSRIQHLSRSGHISLMLFKCMTISFRTISRGISYIGRCFLEPALALRMLLSYEREPAMISENNSQITQQQGDSNACEIAERKRMNRLAN
jgi:hypothetical protein